MNDEKQGEFTLQTQTEAQNLMPQEHQVLQSLDGLNAREIAAPSMSIAGSDRSKIIPSMP